MNYIKLSTLEYPRHEGDIRLEYPEITEDQTGDTFPCPDTYEKVEWVDPPEYNVKTQLIYEIAPAQVNGVWTMQWDVRDLTEQELAGIAEQEKILQDMSKRPNTDVAGSLPNAI